MCEKAEGGSRGEEIFARGRRRRCKTTSAGPDRNAFPAPRPGQGDILIGDAIHKLLKQDVRVTSLGHIQRGESPGPFDRILATHFGVDAVELVARGEFGRMVCLRAAETESLPPGEAVGETRLVDPEGSMVRTTHSVGLTFGDQ